MPAGLTITLELGAPVTVHDTVGSEIQARVAFDVKDRRRILVPVFLRFADAFGAWSAPPTAVNTMWSASNLPTSRPLSGTARFYANLQDLEKRPNIKLILSNVTGSRQSDQIWLPYLPGVASFFVTGEMFDFPRGFGRFGRRNRPADYVNNPRVCRFKKNRTARISAQNYSNSA